MFALVRGLPCSMHRMTLTQRSSELSDRVLNCTRAEAMRPNVATSNPLSIPSDVT